MTTGRGAADIELLVCMTCRRAGVEPPADTREGATLFAALAEAAGPDGPRVVPVECLSNCRAGCTVALRGPGRWTYVYGALHEVEHVATVLDGAARYAAAPDGLVPWRERPEHFRRNCVARVPPPTPVLEKPE
ncbi:DUF1636 family protein [Rubrimonas cliftonensis]|uniref:Predicted metal-binding protein n=1 Tax=Rubrimonas cliftonensis TaxID=89524 RepID=A0A1H4FW58_9RHOB|nr:DUF1636 domain-containing protein [Rubrimonas cliftonensis]SEB01593.1 Predicted metal-binding protein [Rubrimonas cliftonensis]